MALNKAVFKTRSLTAVVFAAIMLAGMFINGILFLGLCILIAAGCFIEYLRLVKMIYKRQWFLYLLPGLVYTVLPLVLLARLGFSKISVTGTGLHALMPSFEYAPLLPALVIFSIWINDTMAYIVGSFIGKTPFSKISPKKTWEGTVGGAVLCVAVICLLGRLLPGAQDLTPGHIATVAALAAVCGTAGDLFESKLKRMAGVKDSGNVLPGHGGFLDRFDSLLFAAPAVYLYLRFFL